MNTLTKLLLVTALAGFCAHGVFAKTTIRVRIQADHGVAAEVSKSIAARLQGTERYEVTDGDAELYVHLSCMAGTEVTNANGYICSYTYAYYPEKLSQMENCLGPSGLVTGRDVSFVAEAIFTSFVVATTDAKLESARKDIRIGVARYCHSTRLDQNAREDCGQKADK